MQHLVRIHLIGPVGVGLNGKSSEQAPFDPEPNQESIANRPVLPGKSNIQTKTAPLGRGAVGASQIFQTILLAL